MRYRNVPAVEVALLSIPVVTPHVKGGRMKAFGVTTAKRSAMLSDVPTIAESGVGGGRRRAAESYKKV